MSENIISNEKNENDKINNEEINYSFSALNNSNSKGSNNNKIRNENNNTDLNPNTIKKKDVTKKNSLKKGKILGGQFILGEEIGKGTFGIVRVATHIISGEKVAVKMLYKEKIYNDDSSKKRLEKEIKILKVLRHRNIIQLYNVFQDSSFIFFVMEYIHGKELFEIIIKKKRISELESLLYFQQLISGIEYLGKLGIAHRDLKPENLLIDSKKVLKIADFGLSNTYKKSQLLSTPCGSPSYAAPEMLSGNKYWGLGADIWSCGVILYTMLCGRLPFEDKDNIKLYQKIKEGNFTIPEFISENAKDFLKKILNVEPKKRYNITQIKKHPWFNQLDQNKYMTRGLLINKYIVPIDEEIVEKMRKDYDFNEKEIKMNLLANKHNHITTTYYLFLKQKIKKGKHSVADMVHSEFINYIHNPKNFLANYNGDWNKLFKERAYKKINNNFLDIDFNKRNSKNIEINDNKINNKFNKTHNKDKDEDKNLNGNINNNNNEFKEKIEEIYKKRNSKINLEQNNKNININTKSEEVKSKEKLEDKKKIRDIKENFNLKNIEKKEQLITINLGEIKSDKNKNNFTPSYAQKYKNSKISKNNSTINNKFKVNKKTAKTYNKTISTQNSETQKNKPKSEILKKPIVQIPKFRANNQKNIKEENQKKIKMKTISIQIKNISIDSRKVKRYSAKTEKFQNTLSYIDNKYSNKIKIQQKNNSMHKITFFPNISN